MALNRIYVGSNKIYQILGSDFYLKPAHSGADINIIL